MRGGGDKERHDRDGGQPDQQEDRPSAALVEPPGVEHREESGGALNAAVGAGDHRGEAGVVRFDRGRKSERIRFYLSTGSLRKS